MFAVIPIFSFFLFWFNFYQKNHEWRQSFLYAAALWGSVVWFLTEIPSLFYALSFGVLMIGWLIVAAGAGCCAVFNQKAFDFGKWTLSLKTVTLTEKIILFFIVSIAVLKGISAIYSAPNTSDALSYHLTRVEHWIQNRTIANYPSHVTRELYSPPWAEYAILQLRILSQGDYFSNAVQWFSAIGSWVAVSGLAGLLGANRKGQLMAVLLAASLPMSLVQATSTQTDYVMTFWVAGFVYLLWLMYQKSTWGIAFTSGIFLGLAFLTKGNTYLLVPVWMIVYLIASITTRNYKKLKFLAFIVLVACLFNVPYAIRNTSTFGSPYWTHSSFVNQSISPSKLISSMGSNLILHIDQRQRTGEDDTANEFYLILMMGVLLWLFFYHPFRRKFYLNYALCIVLMFTIFSAVVPFAPFNIRFHLAIFIISTALVGTVLAQWLPHQWTAAAAILIYISSWPWLFKCNEHPLIGPSSIFHTTRMQQYFSERSLMVYPFSQTVKLIGTGNCRDIGLISNENEWGYLWWVLFRQNFGDHFRIEDVGVGNKSALLAFPSGPFNPCALIATNDNRTEIALSSGVYARVWSMQLPDDLTSVFIKVL